MRADVQHLRDFYDSPLGRVTRRLVRRRLRQMWPDVHGLSLLGLGYATPYLRAFRAEATRVLAAMPPEQGVMAWPRGEPNLVVLGQENALPLPDRALDRVLLVHALEGSDNVRGLMRECWRVLADDGRLLVVVPSRTGIWARLERTPFGLGRPYSPGQLSQLLTDSLFTPLRTERALFLPPNAWRPTLASGPALEQVGRRWFATLGGVLLAEATKQIYRPVNGLKAARRHYVVLPQPLRRQSLEDAPHRPALHR
ncbi:methyltransferase domain-containing protein [Roseospirillum parvum]|uniref:Methyltransferase domain-containing protein n=1 Tax=Roseospirillum parvum TaxID=83401 RepID=A0A1G7U5B9_9PROT|nr:methyltransferase domain-containing protein [Roseospirillum parvum]SDG42578.1 Methyltransferase domain-containing protein [Roseospirillum parvum]